ncbi:uncharacterized protein BO96DRAFT_93740 [Aspergillus niger CBS 101883]|uniref:uncharacterized protein n=1 Tax=Aspergillus lacticoffeatus (strain CBS 101883) TaxID=1450533 RepID=UPI000D7ED1FA|nr:uncharacterized protein BO96DRAFT_93740 [Aspergillus niger CBS 101883]PYH61253.1 hypothetical protein BO96DRAFT_93740 [Aspergillus niger CBS 101883]
MVCCVILAAFSTLTHGCAGVLFIIKTLELVGVSVMLVMLFLTPIMSIMYLQEPIYKTPSSSYQNFIMIVRKD